MSYKIINPEIINKSMMGNPQMIKQFVEMYIEQSPLDFQALENSIISGNKQAISDHAHHIKPTMEYIGASCLRITFQELENMGKNKIEIAIIRQKFAEVKSSFLLMMKELQSFLNENNLKN